MLGKDVSLVALSIDTREKAVVGREEKSPVTVR